MNRNQLNKLQGGEYGYLWRKHFKMTIRERIGFRIEMKGVFGFDYPQTNPEEGC